MHEPFHTIWKLLDFLAMNNNELPVAHKKIFSKLIACHGNL